MLRELRDIRDEEVGVRYPDRAPCDQQKYRDGMRIAGVYFGFYFRRTKEITERETLLRIAVLPVPAASACLPDQPLPPPLHPAPGGANKRWTATRVQLKRM